jgi:hypothetical protein
MSDPYFDVAQFWHTRSRCFEQQVKDLTITLDKLGKANATMSDMLAGYRLVEVPELHRQISDLKDKLSCAESEEALNADSFHVLDLKIKYSQAALAYATIQYTNACMGETSAGLSEFDMTVKALQGGFDPVEYIKAAVKEVQGG